MPEEERIENQEVNERTTLLPNDAEQSQFPEDTPPPDGGREAWTQVAVAHLININVFGFIASFGVFQEYYVDYLRAQPSTVSWVGSVNVFLVFLLSSFTGRATDAGYFRIMLFVGLILQVSAVFLTSFSTQYWQVFLFQGILKGIGNGLLYCPALALVSTYFDKRRTMALSIVACGGATGGVAFPAIARSMLYQVGFSWTMRTIGLVMAFNGLIAVVFSKSRLAPRLAGPLIDWNAFKQASYMLFIVGIFLNSLGIFFAYYYISPFATTQLNASPSHSFTLLLALNFPGLFGRLIPAYISDTYLGPLNTLISASLIGGIILYSWTTIDTLLAMYILVAFIGFFLATVQSLFPSATTSFAHSLDKVGVRLGMCFSLVGFACLAGPPIGGFLIERQDGAYLGAQIFGGSVMVSGGLFLLASRLAESGWVLRKKI